MRSGNSRLRATDELKKEFSRRLLKELIRNEMTQSELGRRIGLSRDAVSTYARGRSLPSDKTLIKICSVLGVDATDMLPARYDVASIATPLQITLLNNGSCRLQIDTEIDTDLALDIIGRLREAGVYAK